MLNILLIIANTVALTGIIGLIIARAGFRQTSVKKSDEHTYITIMPPKSKKKTNISFEVYEKIVRSAYKLRGQMTEFEVLKIICDIKRAIEGEGKIMVDYSRAEWKDTDDDCIPVNVLQNDVSDNLRCLLERDKIPLELIFSQMSWLCKFLGACPTKKGARALMDIATQILDKCDTLLL